jgi:site-specific DNA-cytosine methylase
MLRILELFCGIGGLAAALDGRAQVVAAVDVNTSALAVYAGNFPHPVRAGKVESLPAPELRRWDADLWWLSPPCQPFTRRGLRRDDEDPRARPFLALLERLAEVRPRYVALENVPGFRGSNVHARLRETLDRAGYAAVHERLLCPSELGVPNRRERYYLVASRERLEPPAAPGPAARRPLREYLDAEADPRLCVGAELLRSYEGALDLVDAQDPSALTSCFTSAYGRSHVRSGSYLVTEDGVRRFSPREILRLLGFPASFVLPPEMPLGKAWRLAGNSLSLAPVRAALSAIPELFR